jgi:predicted TIM-barrel fold metal-dependent hydrolase
METPVIDFHTHSGRWGNIAVFDDPKRYIEIMDAAGVDRANINCIFHSDASKGNNIVAERFVSQYPDRFIGVAFVTPHYPEEAIPELERAFNELNLRSLKVYPTYYGKPIDDPGYLPIFEWCNDRGITLMSHSSHGPADDGLTIPTSFSPLAQRYTNMNWVLAHSGNGRPGQELAVQAAQACPNIYLETCSSFADHKTIDFLVEGAGEDRVLFGSDMPLMDARAMVGRIVTSGISEQAKRKVLGLNALKVLGLDE